MSRSLHILEGIAAPLALANVDTDSIFPSRFMKTVSRDGLGSCLFHDLRYGTAGAALPGFVLNRMPWRDAVFLIACENFGCGSSREHAPWALLDFGIRCIIAPSFADIFAGNCLKNGILPLSLEVSACDRLMTAASQPASSKFRLDLCQQTVQTGCGDTIAFAIKPEHRRRLLLGLDDIDESLRHIDEIAAHEARASYPRPFVSADLDGLVRVLPRARSEMELGT